MRGHNNFGDVEAGYDPKKIGKHRITVMHFVLFLVITMWRSGKKKTVFMHENVFLSYFLLKNIKLRVMDSTKCTLYKIN